jgi:hypothetical protein
MIIFFSEGRLGNQLFQYAFLNTIAKDDEMIFSLNMSELTQLFEIENKNFKQITPNRYITFFLRFFVRGFLLKILAWLKIISFIRQDRNSKSAFPSYQHMTSRLLPITFVNTDFFQSESFFSKNKINIKLKSKYLLKAKSFLTNVPDGHNKIFVHLRLGDYKSLRFQDQLGIDLPLSYYLSAIAIMKSKFKNPFFIFLSDDVDYITDRFSEIPNMIISKKSMAVDMCIMTLCDGGICSNSSFSWWGAYFMNSKENTVMPKYWYGWKQKIDSHVGIQPKWATILEV